MKKIIIKGLFFVAIGFFLGQLLFGEKIELIKHLQNKDTYYFLEEGVYNNYKSIQNNANIYRKIIENKNNKYHVYIGITRDKEVLEKLKKIYKKDKINVSIKEITLESKEFKNHKYISIEKYDFFV